jgi:hypothetical protein
LPTEGRPIDERGDERDQAERQEEVGERLGTESPDDERVGADLADAATRFDGRERTGDEQADRPFGRSDAGGGRYARERRRTLLRALKGRYFPERGAMMRSRGRVVQFRRDSTAIARMGDTKRPTRDPPPRRSVRTWRR